MHFPATETLLIQKISPAIVEYTHLKENPTKILKTKPYAIYKDME